jgi:hypothetical protein
MEAATWPRPPAGGADTAGRFRSRFFLRAEITPVLAPAARVISGKTRSRASIPGKTGGTNKAAQHHSKHQLAKGQPLRAHQRPQTAKCANDRMKLHRHAVSIGGRSYTVITLRRGAYARFSNNFYHGTWHILSDLHGARVLGRLLWGLSYQRVAGTLVLIDRPNIDPSPFSAAPADPIVLVPSDLTVLPERAARALRSRLPLTRPEGTVRWHTPGLDLALAARRDDPTASRAAAIAGMWKDRDEAHRIARTGGLVTFAATPRLLRDWAVEVYRLGEQGENGMDCAFLGYEWRLPDGEVQIFTDYRRRVNAARAARREILSEIPDGLPKTLPDADIDPLIWERHELIRQSTRPRPQTS